MGDFEKFYNAALRFLSFRPRSEKETRDRLFQKKAPKEVIDKIILKLKTQKFIDDEKFTKWWIDQRLSFKPRSITLIKRELLQKGVGKEIIDAQISNFQFPISNELENAKKLINKKIVRYKNLSKREVYQKLGSYLARRGFNWDTIKQSIDESLS
jgi:regulatory protein